MLNVGGLEPICHTLAAFYDTVAEGSAYRISDPITDLHDIEPRSGDTKVSVLCVLRAGSPRVFVLDPILISVERSHSNS